MRHVLKNGRVFSMIGLPGCLAGCVAAAALFMAGCAANHVGSKSSSSDATAELHAPKAAPVMAAEARQRLIDGNMRFRAGRSEHPRQTPDERTRVANGQQPFAIILACSDSRTSPEILFDQGLGDLFVVRVAGNVVDDQALGTMEYGVEHLHSRLIVVLGHERCGAIAAARDVVASHGHADGHIESLVTAIRPAVEATSGQDAEATCRANVHNMVHAIKSADPILKHAADGGEIAVVGAYYDLDTGDVRFLGDANK